MKPPATSRPSSMGGQKYHWRPASASGTECYPAQPAHADTESWCQKACEMMDYPNMDPDMPDFNPTFMTHDEDSPIIDLRQNPTMRQDPNTGYLQNPSQRFSGASFSTTSTGTGFTYDDFSSETDTHSYTASDYDSWGPMDPSSNLLSPLTSPQRHDPVRTVSRGGASPGPHNHSSVRSSPYTLESDRMKRWSTGMTGAAPTSTPALAVHQVQDRFANYGQRLNPQSMPAFGASTMSMHRPQSQYVLSSQPHPLPSTQGPMFSPPHQRYQLEAPRPVPSQGMYGLLQSNDHQHHGCSAHFADFSEPPNLYASLQQEPSDPPPEDFNPSDPDMVPKEQELRFEGDLYTPRWVRGHGNKREGWCGLCKPGRWLVLKNSAYWYDKSFTHGVSANTGAAFQGPRDTRRTEGNLDVWEGLCGSCGDWVALVSSKKKGTTWFRHAYKCHTHPKAKDGPKRRRETSSQQASRNAGGASSTRPSTAVSLSSSRPNSSSHPQQSTPSIKQEQSIPDSIPYGAKTPGSDSTPSPRGGRGPMVSQHPAMHQQPQQAPQQSYMNHLVHVPTPHHQQHDSVVGASIKGYGGDWAGMI
ncbi:Conserved fungal protein [Lasiodiplodia theobromae]|uniref:Meiotic expression up-regulated protein 26 n=1 Tax=Lasiodiplodia theobromae TaxID=45133 RepID=A0A5N5D272_9PEZI|nr:Conserved fungal protein [Lasiodiplodia theobromae]KAB2571783.1 Meiotic expression up-regulated protein 26 [Lasiodiplodia theobromae]KAF4539770.1 Conserved fungal protein [Lasiodiplodia theobromae]